MRKPCDKIVRIVKERETLGLVLNSHAYFSPYLLISSCSWQWMKVVGKLYAWLYLETAAGYEANYGSKLRTVINLRVLEVKTILNIHEQYVLGWSMCLHAAWTRCKCMLWRLSHLHDITEYHHRLMLHFVHSYDYRVKGWLEKVQFSWHQETFVMCNV